MPKIELKNVTKTYNEGKIVAVDNISLTIDDGEYVFLLGPTGCGKTTTLRLIAGLENPTSGKILIDGKDMSNVPPNERNMGFIFQNFEIFEHLTVLENVTFGLEIKGLPQKVIEDKAIKALKLLGLYEYKDEYPNIFGNPGLQKLGIARAIAIEPRILIMDEPLGSLDPKISQIFRYELRNLIKRLKITAIQVTHDQECAISSADKIIIMRNGKLLQMGNPFELYENPNSIFVANFLGETNFLEGFVLKLVGKEAMQVWIRMGGPKMYINNFKNKFNLDDSIVIAFRYEDVYLFHKDYDFKNSKYDWYKMNFFKATLENSRFVGTTKRFYLRLDNGDRFVSIKPGTFEENFEPGDEIICGVHQNDIFPFKRPDDLDYELSLQ